MKLKKISLLVSIMGIFFVNLSSFAAEYTSNIQSLVLEDFELSQDGKPKRQWILIPDRFGREGNSDAGESLQTLRWVKAWPEAYFGKEVQGKTNAEFFYGPVDNEDNRKRYTDVSGTCLGMKLMFNRQGYNAVELYPLAEKDGKYVKQPLPFKGKVKQMDFWIWGANYDYFVEAVFVDFRNVEHRITVGSIKHVGWKNFVVTIPNYIPQSVTYIPSLKQLSLVKFVIWTNPEEKVSGAYIYMDHIKYLADVYSDLYDGYQLGTPDAIKTLWDKAPAPPKESDVRP